MQGTGWLASALMKTAQPSGVQVSLLHEPKLKGTTFELVSDGVYHIKAEFKNCMDTLRGCRERMRCVVMKNYEVAVVLSDTWAKSEMILVVKDCQVGAHTYSTPIGLKSHKAITGVASLVRTVWQDLHHTTEKPKSWKGFSVLMLSLSGYEDTYLPPYLKGDAHQSHTARPKEKMTAEVVDKGGRGDAVRQHTSPPATELIQSERYSALRDRVGPHSEAGLTGAGPRGAGLTGDGPEVQPTNVGVLPDHTSMADHQSCASHNDSGSLTNAYPVTIGNHPFTIGNHPVTIGNHPVTRGNHPVTRGNHPVTRIDSTDKRLEHTAPSMYRRLSDSSLDGYVMPRCEVTEIDQRTNNLNNLNKDYHIPLRSVVQSNSEETNDGRHLNSTDFAISGTQQDALEQLMESDDCYVVSPRSKECLAALQDWIHTLPIANTGPQTMPMTIAGSQTLPRTRDSCFVGADANHSFSSEALYSSACSTPDSCLHLSIPTSSEEDTRPAPHMSQQPRPPPGHTSQPRPPPGHTSQPRPPPGHTSQHGGSSPKHLLTNREASCVYPYPAAASVGEQLEWCRHTEPQRGAEPSQRGAGPSQRGAEPSQRGTGPSQRGAEPSQRGAEPSQRLSHMGNDCLHQHVVPNVIQGTYHGQEGHYGAGVQLRHQPLVQVGQYTVPKSVHGFLHQYWCTKNIEQLQSQSWHQSL